MIKGFAILLAFQLAGEQIAGVLRLPVSGPICGMALLLAGLSLRGGSIDADLDKAASALLANMPILFVPVGVGVVMFGDILSRDGIALGIAIVASTLLAIVATATLHFWLATRTPQSRRQSASVGIAGKQAIDSKEAAAS